MVDERFLQLWQLWFRTIHERRDRKSQMSFLISLLVKLFTDSFSPAYVEVAPFARSIYVRELYRHFQYEQTIGFVIPVDTRTLLQVGLKIKYQFVTLTSSGRRKVEKCKAAAAPGFRVPQEVTWLASPNAPPL